MFQKFGKDIPQDLVDMVSGIMYEAKADEPAAPDADAIARRKRLQAIKDKQEDDAAERGTGEKKSSGVRQVAGKAYGGAKQKDDKEDMEEAYGCDTKKEELIGGQKKLDKNHNGKLDSDDFKKLRKEEGQIDEVLTKKSPMKTWIKDFVHSKNSKFAGKSSAERSKMAQGAFYGKQKEEVELTEGKMKDIYGSMMKHADKKGYSSHKQFTKADYETVGKQHGVSGADLAVIGGHHTADSYSKLKEGIEQVVEYAGQPKDVPFDADKPHGKIATPGKEGYGPSAARHLARQGLKKFLKKETLMGKAGCTSEEADLEESRGHKILANKLRQIDTMSTGIAPDHNTNPQSTKDKIKDAKNIGKVEIVTQKDTSVKKEDVETTLKLTEEHHFGSNVDSHIKSLGHGKIGFVMDQKKDSLIAVHHQDGGKHHLAIFHKGNLVNQSTHNSFDDASGHAHSALTTKKGMKALNLKEEVQIDEASAEFMKGVKQRVSSAKSDKYSKTAKLLKHIGKGDSKLYDKMADTQKKLSKEEVQIDETAALDQYIKSMGYDPEHMEKNKKVMFSKTNAFKTWAQTKQEALYDAGQKGTQDIDTHMSPGATARG